MPLIANNFLAGSLISLLMPTGLLIAITIWYVVVVRHVPGGRRERSSSDAATPAPPAETASPEVDPPASSP
jgi:hypothetical protein